jgi:hypothetical protein
MTSLRCGIALASHCRASDCSTGFPCEQAASVSTAQVSNEGQGRCDGARTTSSVAGTQDVGKWGVSRPGAFCPKADRQVVAAASPGISEIGWIAVVGRSYQSGR